MAAEQYAESTRKHIDYKQCTVTASDNEDHSFNGICFDVECRSDKPIAELVITSFSLRGVLGPMNIFITKPGIESHFKRNYSRQFWDTHFDGIVAESWDNYREISLHKPVFLARGERRGVYIISRTNHDLGIIYDNVRRGVINGDMHLNLHPGCAQTGPTPFSSSSGWGWRNNRAFVGRVGYGVRYVLWSCPTHRVSSFSMSFLCFCSLKLLSRSCHSVLPDALAENCRISHNCS